MELQQTTQCVQQVQPKQSFQPTPNAVYVGSSPPRRAASGWTKGALIFSVVTLILCPESFLCTIPSCTCAILAMTTPADLPKNLSTLSIILTGFFYIAFIIACVCILIYFLSKHEDS